jgi:hypothetical protein
VDFYDILSTLIEAADREAESLQSLIDSTGAEEIEARAHYQDQLTAVEAAIKAGRSFHAPGHNLVWLVQRATAIRTAKGWSKAERDRSWDDWQDKADHALLAFKTLSVEG